MGRRTAYVPYQPKLAIWGRKLAYLLAEGWNIEEIRSWAKGRWSTKNPREWPPKHELWCEIVHTDAVKVNAPLTIGEIHQLIWAKHDQY